MACLRLLCLLALVCWIQQVNAAEPKTPPTPLETCGDRPMVSTNQGPICGIHCPSGPREVCGKQVETVKTRNYRAFAGIPFAKPPVGQLRFKSPVPGEPWSDYRDGSWMPPMCPQMDMLAFMSGNLTFVGQEDCLFLNVYMPEVPVPDEGFPVMVWIHGGAFVMGGVQEYFADKLMTRNVILVSLQYRLGVLGFLSTEDDVAPGNFGLKDQELALRWVQDNIVSFGGDPSKVTIFGESAGACSVHLQMLNPQAKGLFSKAIMQSGTALISVFQKLNFRETAFQVANKLDCNIQKDGKDYNSEELLKCLQNIPDSSAFVGVQYTFVEWGFGPVPYSPRAGEATLPGLPEELLRDGNYNKVDVMMGINLDEGGLFTKYMYMLPNGFKDLAANFSRIGHYALNLDAEHNEDVKLMFEYYMGGIREYKEEDADLLAKLFGDYFFDIPHDHSLELHSRDSLYGKNVYAYELKHRGDDGLLSLSLPHIGKDWVNHGDDLMYLFKLFPDFFNETDRPDNKKLESIMLDLWVNFATHGNPTPDRSLGFTWAPVTLQSKDHLVLKPKPYMEADTRCQRRKFMNSLNLSINQVLFPGRIGQGPNWKPWRLQEQNKC